MIAAILRAQFLSMRPRRGGRRASSIFSAITALLFYGVFVFLGWGVMLFFSSPDVLYYFVPALCGGFMLVMLYWQLAPVISASMGSSIDLRKLLAYPVPHNSLFLVEILLRITTCFEMLLLIAGAVAGLLRNPLFGLRAAPYILGGALAFSMMNILLSAGTRNLLERLFLRTRLREILVFVFVIASITPQILLYTHVKKAAVLYFVPSQAFWPWAAPARLMLRDQSLAAAGIMLLWLAAAWVFSRWQFERNIRYDVTQPRQSTAVARSGDTFADRIFGFPSRFLRDPIGAMVEKELRTLTRIPRFRLVYLMSTFFGAVVYLPTLARNKTPSAFMLQAGLPMMSLYGLLMLGQISYWNSLGFDRSAVQGYFSWPLRFRDVLISKNLSVICLLVPQIFLVAAVGRMIHLYSGPAKILETIIVMLVASLYWLSLGNICSVRMPRALDPGKMNQMANKLQALTIFVAPLLLFPLALAYWCRWFFESQLVFAGLVVISAILGGIFYWVGLDSAVQSASSRREAIITELSATEGPLSIT